MAQNLKTEVTAVLICTMDDIRARQPGICPRSLMH